MFAYTAETPDAPQLPEGYSWLLLDQQLNERFFAKAVEDRWRLHAYSELLRRGFVGHVLHVDGEWAAVQWLATPDSGGPRHLPATATAGRYWCFNEHTRVQHRRRGLWRVLKDQGVRYIRESSGDQTTVLFSDTELSNTASRIAHESYGFTQAGVIDRVTLRVPRLTSFTWGTWQPGALHPSAPSSEDQQ